jgi:hypothetical protein
MKAFPIALLLVAAFGTPSQAKPPACDGPEFQAYRTAFMDAANANDKNRLAKLITFPVESWSTVDKKNGAQTNPVKTEAEFMQRYDSLFTPFMRKHLKTAKLLSMQEGRCALVWHDANTEFSFEFQYVPDGGFRVTGYDIGPY